MGTPTRAVPSALPQAKAWKSFWTCSVEAIGCKAVPAPPGASWCSVLKAEPRPSPLPSSPSLSTPAFCPTRRRALPPEHVIELATRARWSSARDRPGSASCRHPPRWVFGLLSDSSRLPPLLQVRDPLESESQAFYLPFLTCNLVINGWWSPL